MLTNSELVMTITIIAGGTLLTRFLPFIFFPSVQKVPPVLQRLQNLLPGAAIGLLVVYSLRDLNFLEGNRGLPEILAVGAVLLLERAFKQPLLSIALGTALYMLLLQRVLV